MKTIAVIEDDESIRDNIEEILQLYGYHVVTAKNGRDGLKLIKGTNPALVICNVNMPVMDGIALFLALRSAVETKDIPFIFVSAKSHDTAIENIIKKADGFIAKPFTMEDLEKAVEGCLPQ